MGRERAAAREDGEGQRRGRCAYLSCAVTRLGLLPISLARSPRVYRDSVRRIVWVMGGRVLSLAGAGMGGAFVLGFVFRLGWVR
jgi:hypothetical protein